MGFVLACGSTHANRDVRFSLSTTTGFPYDNAHPLHVSSGSTPSFWLLGKLRKTGIMTLIGECGVVYSSCMARDVIALIVAVARR